MKKDLPLRFGHFLMAIMKKARKDTLLFLFFFCSIGQALYVLLPGLLGLMIDKIFVEKTYELHFITIFPLIWLFSIVLSSTGKFFLSSIIQDVRKVSKEILFHHLIHLPNENFIEKNTGEFEHLMQELSLDTRYVFAETLPFLVRILTTLLAALLVVSYTSIELVLFFIFWIVLFLPLSYISSIKSLEKVSESLSSSADVSAATVEVIENHELIPAFGTQNSEIQRFREILQREKDVYSHTQFKIDVADFIQRISQLILPICFACYLVFFEKFTSMSPGAIASIFSLTLLLASQVSDFGRGILGFLEIRERANAALRKLQPKHPERREREPRSKATPTTWEITCTDVSFGHKNNFKLTLKNINLCIKEGEKIGVVGRSGAGKTTLVKLLRGLYSATEGQVAIGGILIDQIDPSILTSQIAEVSQTIPLFHRSIRENVAYGCSNVDDSVIWEILEKAQMASFVKKLPQGLDTLVGVKGQKLSGGEKARIGIARALFRQSKIIIFDEATAAVDSHSEALIQKALKDLIHGKTFIVIAHRLSTLRKMERILLMDNGRIIDQGGVDILSYVCDPLVPEMPGGRL